MADGVIKPHGKVVGLKQTDNRSRKILKFMC